MLTEGGCFSKRSGAWDDALNISPWIRLTSIVSRRETTSSFKRKREPWEFPGSTESFGNKRLEKRSHPPRRSCTNFATSSHARVFDDRKTHTGPPRRMPVLLKNFVPRFTRRRSKSGGVEIRRR